MFSKVVPAFFLSVISFTFSYAAPPVVTSVDPSSGSTLGDTNVYVYGSNIVYGATVYFDNKECDVLTYVSTTQVACNTQQHKKGNVSVTITNPNAESGTLNNGYLYTVWEPTFVGSIPSARYLHSALWTGSKMLIWGGIEVGNVNNTGATYDPITNNWAPTSMTGAPVKRASHTAVWTGTKMIVWGGAGEFFFQALNSGGVYDLASDTWTPTSAIGAPSPRIYQTAVWTGTKMIVWGGGESGNYFNNGGMYDPSTNSWSSISTTNAPSARSHHVAVWTGSKLIVWGGQNTSGFLNSGGIYDPVTNTWSSISTTNAPIARTLHTGVWTGSKLIVWGGSDGSSALDSGGNYDPVTNTWTPTSFAPTVSRYNHSAVWTGTKMIIWGGQNQNNVNFDSGAIYTPSSDTWVSTITGNNINVPQARANHSAVWANDRMIIWGGRYGVYDFLNTGATYDAKPSKN